MIEHLGPNMVRTIVGDAYDPAFRYELETNEEGFHLIVTNKESGESNCVDLTDTIRPEEPPKQIWDEEKLNMSRHHIIVGPMIAVIIVVLIMIGVILHGV